VLADTLRRADCDGLIVRILDPDRVETATLYQLTELGRSIDERPLDRHPHGPTSPGAPRLRDIVGVLVAGRW
jgi:hypothetical protein